MALSITWDAGVIYVPKADLTLVSGTLYEHDTNAFRLELGAILASEKGIVYPDAHDHIAGYTVAGVSYSRKVEIISPYSIEYENGSYSVRLAESNNNLFDVEGGILVQNNVSVIGQNSAGLQVVSIGSGLSPEEQQQLQEILDIVSTRLLTKGLYLRTKK